MGADIKNLRIRIKSVDSTLHLTGAMGLVAASKIRRANEAMSKGLEYAAAIRQTVSMLSASKACTKSPYMRPYNGGKTRLIVIAGDRGLAGGYNANIFRLMRGYRDAEVIPIGKRACERYGKEIISSERYGFDDAYVLAKKLCADFAEGKYDRLGIVCTKYVSMMIQEAQIVWLLPLVQNGEFDGASAIFEPDEMSILNAVMPEYVAGLLIAALRESFASEVAARRCAMDSAGKNAQQMIDTLQLEYNRARQGTITQEITEIVAGSGL